MAVCAEQNAFYQFAFKPGYGRASSDVTVFAGQVVKVQAARVTLSTCSAAVHFLDPTNSVAQFLSHHALFFFCATKIRRWVPLVGGTSLFPFARFAVRSKAARVVLTFVEFSYRSLLFAPRTEFRRFPVLVDAEFGKIRLRCVDASDVTLYEPKRLSFHVSDRLTRASG